MHPRFYINVLFDAPICAGRKACEWSQLAAWFYEFKLAHENVRWLIQIPRLYHIYRYILSFYYDLKVLGLCIFCFTI